MFVSVIRTPVRYAGLCALLTMALTACGADQGSADAPPATQVTTPISPATTSQATTSPATNSPLTNSGSPVKVVPNVRPTISGLSRTSINVGSEYGFTPTVTNPSGGTLVFSIQNKPAWATFDTVSGTPAGTPAAADAGTYANIIISVTDGTTSVSLPAFTLTVQQISNGAVTLDWTPPTQNTDGTVLSNLGGYRVHYGMTELNLTESVDLKNPGLTNYVVSNLSTGTWYFGVSSYSTTGVESSMSGLVSQALL
jgi:Fibronectin type III domain